MMHDIGFEDLERWYESHSTKSKQFADLAARDEIEWKEYIYPTHKVF